MRGPCLIAIACLGFGQPAGARAAPAFEAFIGQVRVSEEGGERLVDLRFLNPADQPRTILLPDRIEAMIEAEDGGVHTIVLLRGSGTSPELSVGPHGFERGSYSLPRDLRYRDASLSIPAWSTPVVRLELQASVERLAKAEGLLSGPEAPRGARPPAPPPTARAATNAFLGNLSAYEPIYAVYGPGTDSEARVQISFKYQFFGSRAASDKPLSWRDGLHFAYTQRMFWDLASRSSPFRNIDFQPELIYIAPSATLNNGISLSAQGGIRHESNGRDGAESRSINSLYAGPMATIPLGQRHHLAVMPRWSVYVGDRSDNPDIARYRGHAGLFVELGENDGLRLSTTGRFNFGSGLGAVAADLSYPLPRLLGGGPDVYLFAQSFHGYGENLLDYDRRTTRLRIGLAFVR